MSASPCRGPCLRRVGEALGLICTAGIAAFVTAGAQTPRATTPGPVPLLASRSTLPTGRVAYRTPGEIYNEIWSLADSFPDRVTRFELPNRSPLGQTIWGLAVSHDVRTALGKPVFLMTGVHHGNEWETVELTMEFVHDLLQNDSLDPRISSLLDKVRLIVVPLVNPDGFIMNTRTNCGSERHGTSPTLADCISDMGVDLNRNYGGFWIEGASTSGSAPFSEPETQNIRDLLWSNQVTIALSNHANGALVMRVPSSGIEPTPADIVRYDSLAQAVAQALRWKAGPWPDVLYEANGTMEETAYYSAGTFAFTFEVVQPAPWPEFGYLGHVPYSFVVDQYRGAGIYAGSAAREGFLQLLTAAADPALHAILRVKAAAGAVLTLRKSFTMETAALRQQQGRVSSSPRTFPVVLTSSLALPDGVDEVAWHVNPSSRPSQHAKELIPGAWTLTCTGRRGRSQTVDVVVGRGEVATVDLKRCR